MLDTELERKRVPDSSSDVLKGSLPQGLPYRLRHGRGISQYPRLSEENEREQR